MFTCTGQWMLVYSLKPCFHSLVQQGYVHFFFKKIVIISKKNALKISEVKVLSDNLHHAVKIATNLFSLDKQYPKSVNIWSHVTIVKVTKLLKLTSWIHGHANFLVKFKIRIVLNLFNKIFPLNSKFLYPSANV